MSSLKAIALTQEVALTAAVARTVLQIAAPANQRVRVERIGVFFDGTSATAEPVQVEVVRQTTAGTMSALAPKATQPASESIQTQAQHSATIEPTAADVVDAVEVHPQTGYEVVYPFGQEIIVPGGGRLGIVCTATAAVNVRAKLGFEE